MPRHEDIDQQSPMLKVETLFDELVAHYGEGQDRELRAAAKLLLVALDKFRQHGGAGWQSVLDEYVELVKDNPEKFQRILESQRAGSDQALLA